MKKITLLTFLLASILTFGQGLPLNYENGTTTATFEFGGLGFGNIENPDMTAPNTSMRVLEVNKPTGAEWFGGFGYGAPDGPILADMSNGTSFTLKVWSQKANLPIRFEVQRPGEVSYNVIQTVVNANTWTELFFDFTSQVNGSEQYSVIVIQPDYNIGCEGGGCPTIANGALYYFDDIIQIGAPDPTCDDGIQNGDETGVDCGGTDCPTCPETCDDGILNNGETGIDCGGPNCAPCAASDPTTGPNHPGSSGTDMYIYSELSGNANSSDFTGFNLIDFSNPEATFSEPVLAGDKVLRADDLAFFGSGLGENFNATGSYSFVHLNYYATTATALNFSLVDDSLSATICCGNSEEPFFRFGDGLDAPLVTGQWISVFIPLSHFANFPALVNGTWDGTDIKQTLITGNGTVFVDNIYFSTTNTLGTDDFSVNTFKVHPNPANNVWNIEATKTISSIVIFDMLGKQVMTLSPNSENAVIDASLVSKGMYFATITTTSGSESIKLIKN